MDMDFDNFELSGEFPDSPDNFSPPLSPIIAGYSGAKDPQSLADSGLVFCFNCKGQPRPGLPDHSFSPTGYILRQQLVQGIESILCDTEVPPNKRFAFADDFEVPQLTSVFGKRCNPSDPQDLDYLVGAATRNLMCLRILSGPGYSGNNNFNNINNSQDTGYETMVDPEDFRFECRWELRRDVCIFFNCLLGRDEYKSNLWNRDKLDQHFRKFRSALDIQGWSEGMKSHSGDKEGNECNSAIYHLFHLNLDLRWYLLIIYNADSEILSWILEDLVQLALFKFNKEKDNSLRNVQPFNCWCVKELWTMIRLLCEELDKNFWDLLVTAMEPKHAATSIANPDDPPTPRDFSFNLWLLVHIASLSDYTLCGVHISGREISEPFKYNGSSLLHSYLKQWCNSNQNRNGSSSKTAEVNSLLNSLVNYWGFDLETILLLWNDWLTKLDQNNQNPTFLDNFSSIEKWEKLIKSIGAANEKSHKFKTDTDLLISEDNYLSFLKLLVGHALIAKGKDWKKLKHQIGMNLGRNTIQSFGELAVIRLTTLYLVLAHCTEDSLAIVDRLKEILEYFKQKQSPGRKKTILRVMGVAMHLLLKKNKEIQSLEITSVFMDNVNTLMSQGPLDSQKKELIMIYSDLLESLPTSTPEFTSSRSLGRDSLISPNLTMWLSSCGPNYCVRTLRVLNKLSGWIVNNKRNNLVSKERDELATRIQDRTTQFLIQSVILNANRVPSTDVEPMANLAADLTLFAQWNSNSAQLVARNFDHFALNERTCPEVSEFYLKRLLSFIEEESNSMGNYSLHLNSVSEIKWCQSWVRLNALDLSIPDGLSDKVLDDHFRSTSNSSLTKRLCLRGEEWSRGDVHNILLPLTTLAKAAAGGNVFKGESDSNSTRVYGIVRSCAIVLSEMGFEKVYSKGDAQSIACQVLNALICPMVGQVPWEKLPKLVVVALKDFLFEFFEAVVTFPGCANDTFLQRKVQDMVTFAFLGYLGSPLENQLDDTHPAIRILIYSEDNELSLVLQQSIPQITKQVLTSQDPKLTQRFVHAVSTLRNQQLTTPVMRFLYGILSIYVCTSPSTNPEITNNCVSIVLYCCGFGMVPLFTGFLITAFETCMEYHFGFKTKRFFDLTSGLLKSGRPQVKKFVGQELLPIYRRFVEAVESRRGGGKDMALRVPLEKLQKETMGFEN